MVDDVLHAKVATIERCIGRVREDYVGFEEQFVQDQMRQDAIVLNLLRACEAAIGLAMRVARQHRLGLPEQSREAFDLLERAGWLDPSLAARMRAMVGLRNVAVHAYQKLDLGIVRATIEHDLADFDRYTHDLLKAVPEC